MPAQHPQQRVPLLSRQGISNKDHPSVFQALVGVVQNKDIAAYKTKTNIETTTYMLMRRVRKAGGVTFVVRFFTYENRSGMPHSAGPLVRSLKSDTDNY